MLYYCSPVHWLCTLIGQQLQMWTVSYNSSLTVRHTLTSSRWPTVVPLTLVKASHSCWERLAAVECSLRGRRHELSASEAVTLDWYIHIRSAASRARHEQYGQELERHHRLRCVLNRVSTNDVIETRLHPHFLSHVLQLIPSCCGYRVDLLQDFIKLLSESYTGTMRLLVSH